MIKIIQNTVDGKDISCFSKQSHKKILVECPVCKLQFEKEIRAIHKNNHTCCHSCIQKINGDKKFQEELDLLEKINSALEKGIPARVLSYDEKEFLFLKDLYLLTLKPVLYVANIAENDINKPDSDYVKSVRSVAQNENADVVVISAKIEEEIAMLDDEERLMFLEELGLDSSGLDKMIKASYHLLGLISFLTAGPTEVRAWTIKRGTKAPGAAGKIHSDFERGFIRAEIVAFDDLIASKTYQAAKEKGLVRSEGKEYVMKDGDVTLFRFNV